MYSPEEEFDSDQLESYKPKLLTVLLTLLVLLALLLSLVWPLLQVRQRREVLPTATPALLREVHTGKEIERIKIL
jgi:hypothetical protein